tara:strand:- start:9173 stop:9439 length:267 start_codon:yes stop_codon:yes gene_type:complete
MSCIVDDNYLYIRKLQQNSNLYPIPLIPENLNINELSNKIKIYENKIYSGNLLLNNEDVYWHFSSKYIINGYMKKKYFDTLNSYRYDN